jgi:hypothetical protein
VYYDSRPDHDTTPARDNRSTWRRGCACSGAPGSQTAAGGVLIDGVRRAIQGHLVADLLLVLPGESDDFTRRPAGRHWSPMG